jgi:hypothetical protein
MTPLICVIDLPLICDPIDLIRELEVGGRVLVTTLTCPNTITKDAPEGFI